LEANFVVCLEVIQEVNKKVLAYAFEANFFVCLEVTLGVNKKV